MNVEDAFLQSIREAPDDDAPRLIYADWLVDHGDALAQARAELIRVQCELAQLAPDDSRREPLAQRASTILDAHRLDWTDLAFAKWLGHQKRQCRNPLGHEFCKIVRKGIRARIECNQLPEGNARRDKLSDTLTALGDCMIDMYDYTPESADMPLFNEVQFRRGFIEVVTIQDWAVNLFAEALPHLTVLRELKIENEIELEGAGDTAIQRLTSVLPRLALSSLDVASSIMDHYDTLSDFVDSPTIQRLSKLQLWFSDYMVGDSYVKTLADAPNLSGLRELELEHTHRFTDAAFLAILDSPHLVGLRKCRLHAYDSMPLSPAVVQRFAARFGPQIESDASV